NLLVDHRSPLQRDIRIPGGDPAPQHLEIDHHRVQRVLDLVGQVIGQPADQSVAAGQEIPPRVGRCVQPISRVLLDSDVPPASTADRLFCRPVHSGRRTQLRRFCSRWPPCPAPHGRPFSRHTCLYPRSGRSVTCSGTPCPHPVCRARCCLC